MPKRRAPCSSNLDPTCSTSGDQAGSTSNLAHPTVFPPGSRFRARREPTARRGFPSRAQRGRLALSPDSPRQPAQDPAPRADTVRRGHPTHLPTPPQTTVAPQRCRRRRDSRVPRAGTASRAWEMRRAPARARPDTTAPQGPSPACRAGRGTTAPRAPQLGPPWRRGGSLPGAGNPLGAGRSNA